MAGTYTEFWAWLWEQALHSRSPGHKVHVLLSALEFFSFHPFFFFLIIICALILAVFRELSLKAVEVSPEWNKVLNQCEMLRKRVSIHILSSLWVAPENNDPISYTEAKGQDRGKKLTQL